MNYLQIENMKRSIVLILALFAGVCLSAREFNRIPSQWKWLDNQEVIFTYDGSFADSSAFVVNVKNDSRKTGVKAPQKYQ